MDYKNGQIYAIRSHQTDLIYIGSTCTTLTKRFYDHKKKNNTCSSSELMKYADAYIELIENFPCNSKKELNKREGQIIRNSHCVNKNIAGRTIKERYIDNKEHILEIRKQYYIDNKEHTLKKVKQYYIDNKEQILEYKKQYYLKNKPESTSEQPPSCPSP